MMLARTLIFLLVFHSAVIWAIPFEKDAHYDICFTPGQSCTQLVVSAIDQASKQVLVQAYSFTSRPIVKALLRAHDRGVEVNVILDKSQCHQRGFSVAKLFADYHIPTWVDEEPTIAHNKVMIIDHKLVITGSFNFTRAAEEHNAENIILITDTQLAKSYSKNWSTRQSLSRSFTNDSMPY